jgi:fatty acid desaturase
MLPRHPSDWRTVLWAVLMPVAVAAQYARPSLIPYLFPVTCYLALAAGVIAHNHNHCPTFANRRLNRAFGNWLSLFYGYPTFAWVPTHNLNHHRYVNRAGDATITWRHTNRHTLPVALSYFFVSSYWQSDPIRTYIRKARIHDRTLYRRIMFQYALWAATAAALLALALAVHGVRLGLAVWLLVSVGPAVFALWTIMLFNYEQHVHADPWSDHNHSRSWTSPVLNFFLFNNGFHAAHHEFPSSHWSEMPARHAALAPQIHPDLVERSLAWYFVKNYVLAPFAPRFGTAQIGRAPFETEDGRPPDTSTADVPLVG